jgi:hypothetical protein
VGTSGGGRRHGCANHSPTPNSAAQRLPRDGPAGYGTRVVYVLENARVDDRMQNPVPSRWQVIVMDDALRAGAGANTAWYGA